MLSRYFYPVQMFHPTQILLSCPDHSLTCLNNIYRYIYPIQIILYCLGTFISQDLTSYSLKCHLSLILKILSYLVCFIISRVLYPAHILLFFPAFLFCQDTFILARYFYSNRRHFYPVSC